MSADDYVEDYFELGPDVSVPMPRKYGSPACPNCGYKCGCCCYCPCQTPCPTPDVDGDCECDKVCHGKHEAWECAHWVTRYNWACLKSTYLENKLKVKGE
jgi:hypothetical protein